MTSSQSILSDLASFFSISSSPTPTEIPEKSSTNNENESIEIAMTNDVPTTPNNISPINPTTIQSSTQYKEGQTVLYTNSQGLTSKATIQAIHYDNDLQPYYTITFLNGRERQTDDAHLSPLDTANTIITNNNDDNTAANNMSNGLSGIEEGVSIIVNKSLQHCGAYDMSKVDTQIISPTTTTATATDSWEDNNNNGGYTPTTMSSKSSKRRTEIFDYLQSKFSKRRRILFIIIGLLVLAIIIIATSVSVKNKRQRQSTSGKFICLVFICGNLQVLRVCAEFVHHLIYPLV